MMYLDSLWNEYVTMTNVTLKAKNNRSKIVEGNTEIKERATKAVYNIKKREKEVGKKKGKMIKLVNTTTHVQIFYESDGNTLSKTFSVKNILIKSGKMYLHN